MMTKSVLWQIVVGSVLGAVAGLTTALVLGYAWYVGLGVGASVGFFGCAPWEVMKTTKRVSGDKSRGIARAIKSSWQNRWSKPEIKFDTKRVKAFLSNIFLKVAIGLAFWTYVFIALGIIPLVIFEGLSFCCLPAMSVAWELFWFAGIFCFCLMADFFGLGILAIDDQNRERGSVSPAWPLLRSFGLTFGLSAVRSNDGSRPRSKFLTLRAEDGSIFNWREFLSLLNETVIVWLAVAVLFVTPTLFIVDTVLTIMLALATTKRLASVSGATLGYLSGLAWQLAGGGLVGAYACGIGVALAVCACYPLRQSLSQSHWPFLQRQ